MEETSLDPDKSNVASHGMIKSWGAKQRLHLPCKAVVGTGGCFTRAYGGVRLFANKMSRSDASSTDW